jgi:glycosyltransferase involved in cell wall biosynthesis
VKVLLATEVYPPRAGGAGWSTRALALGLRAAGHEVTVLTTSLGPEDSDALRVRRLQVQGRKRLALPRAFAREIARFDGHVIHAQHSLSALGCLAGPEAGRVAVTVRDHWPVCFWSTRISRGALCPGCGLWPMTRCIDGHVPLPRPLGLFAIPYMRGDLAAKRRALRRAGASLAVSEAIAAELRAASIPRVEVLPNVVNAEEVGQIAREPPDFDLPSRFLLFVGKLEENKGVRLLVPAVKASRSGLPLVVLGEGSLARALKFDAAAAGVELHLRGWTHRDDVLRTMARAEMIVFPSLWPEPLSRVLLEGLALGTPAAAMDTGGTREILGGEEGGLLARDPGGLADAVARIAEDTRLRDRLREAARVRALHFSPARLVPRYEAVYRRLQ